MKKPKPISFVVFIQLTAALQDAPGSSHVFSPMNLLSPEDLVDCMSISVSGGNAQTPNQQIHVDLDGEDVSFDSHIGVLEKEIPCAIVNSNRNLTGSLLTFVNQVVSIRRLVVVHEGKEETLGMEYLQTMKWPTILMENKNTIWTVKSYCPTLGLPKLSRITYMTTCRQKNGCSGKIRLKTLCQNPLAGQVVRLAAIPAYPMVLLPHLFGTSGLSGYYIRFYLTLAKALRFMPQIQLKPFGNYLPRNRTFQGGYMEDLMNGDTDVAQSGIRPLFQPIADFGVPLLQSFAQYVTRPPQPKPSYGNIARPFSPVVWVASAAAIASLATLLLVANRMYDLDHLRPFNLSRLERHPANVFLLAFAGLTEPDPLPWFNTHKWSTGRLLVLLWSAAATFLVWFYTSNLRAHLITVDYEARPRTFDDVAGRGQNVYLYNVATMHQSAYLEATGQTSTSVYRLAKYIDQNCCLYDPFEHQGIHRDSPKDLVDNGAFILMETQAIPHSYKPYPLLERGNIHIVDEVVETYFVSYVLRKYSPGTDVLNRVTRHIVEAGLIKAWMNQHLPMRSTLKPQTPKVALRPLETSDFYSTVLFCLAGIAVAIFRFAAEKIKRSGRGDAPMDAVTRKVGRIGGHTTNLIGLRRSRVLRPKA